MKREVLAIRHVYFEDLGSLELVLGDRGQLVRYLDVGRARIDAPDPLDTSLMVVLGGPIGAYDDALFPHLNPLLAMLEKRIAAGLPTIGICQIRSILRSWSSSAARSALTMTRCFPI